MSAGHHRAAEALVAIAQITPPAGVTLWAMLGKTVPVIVGLLTIVYTVILIARGVIALQADIEERRRKRKAA
jgi:hypothetical protein